MNFMHQAWEVKYGQQFQSEKNYHRKADNKNPLGSSTGGLHNRDRKKNYWLNLPLPIRPCEGERYERSTEQASTIYNTDGRF